MEFSAKWLIEGDTIPEAHQNADDLLLVIISKFGRDPINDHNMGYT